MKKVLVMSALVAFSTAFVACSSDDDLVQQKPDVPEESVEEGIPMTVKVADLASRGTDITTSTLEGFTLYSTMTPAWTTGKLFGKDAGGNWTTNSDLSWPDNKTYTFFGITDVDNLADLDDDSHKDVPVVTASTCSFNYAMPISLKPGTDDEYYYNSEDLKDLLVAKTTCSSESGDPAGTLEVEFQHALAQITAIKLYVNQTRLTSKDETVGAGSNYYAFRINGMRIGGLKTQGTYTFDATTPWTVAVAGNGVDEDVFEIPLKYHDFEHNMFYAKGSAANKMNIELSDEGFYIIPQIATGQVVSNGTKFDITGAYVELDAQVCIFNDEQEDLDVNVDELHSASWRVGSLLDDSEHNWYWSKNASDAIGYGQIRCPLKFALLEGNKTYTLVLDLGMAVIKTNGESGTANADEAVFYGLDILAD